MIHGMVRAKHGLCYDDAKSSPTMPRRSNFVLVLRQQKARATNVSSTLAYMRQSANFMRVKLMWIHEFVNVPNGLPQV